MPSYLTSADGTKIAFDQIGNGPPVVIVSGMFCSRRRTQALAEQLARRLAGHLSVVNHDRRGRGDSGDTTPYEIQRELDDLAALVAATGGEAAVYGHSSGAGLAVHAAAHGLPITRLVLHEPPYGADDPDSVRASRDLAEQVRVAITDQRPADAIAAFLTESGAPSSVVEAMRSDPDLLALAATMPYDHEVMGDYDRGGIVPVELIEAIDVPTLVISGGTSPEFFRHTATRIGTLLPNSTHTVLDGHDHGAPADVVAPVVADYVRA